MPKITSIQEGFTRKQVQSILGVSPRQLSAWVRSGLLPQRSTDSGGDQHYSFSDLAAIRAVSGLLRQGFTPAKLRSACVALKSRIGAIQNPWSEFEFRASGNKFTIHFQDLDMETTTGQLLFAYNFGPENSSVHNKVIPLRPASCAPDKSESRFVKAERFFHAALRFEKQHATIPKALQAYKKAISLNPTAVGAYINLGTLYFTLGLLDDAEKCYRQALAMDPEFPLIHFNLGNAYDGLHDTERAILHYKEASRLNPTYPDPLFNLALLYEKLEMHGKARTYWIAYLKLDGDSEWAQFARRQLASSGLYLVPPQQPNDSDNP